VQILTAGVFRLIARCTLVSGLVIATFGLVDARGAGASSGTPVAVSRLARYEVAVYNAVETFDIRSNDLTNSSTLAQVEAVAKPLGLVIQTFRSELVGQAWPATARSDLKSVDQASSPLTSDLLTGSAITSAPSISAWLAETASDLRAWIADADVVNHVLRMPMFRDASYVDACSANAEIVLIAVKAFRASNPGLAPTRPRLLGTAHGGPYLSNWPENAPYYSISLNASGQVLISAPANDRPSVYSPTVCYGAFS